MRADALSNREAILAAAARLYAVRELVVPAVDVAREAGVGRATVARRFPTTASLRLAVLEQLVERMETIASGLPRSSAAMEMFFDQTLTLFDDNAALLDVIRSGRDTPLGADDLLDRLRVAIAEPLQAAQAAGAVHENIDAEDVRLLLFMASSALRSDPRPDSRRRVLALIHRSLTASEAPGAPDQRGSPVRPDLS